MLHSLVKRPSALRARRTKEKNERYIRDEHAGTTMEYFFPQHDQSIAILPGESNHAIHLLSSPVSIITISEEFFRYVLDKRLS